MQLQLHTTWKYKQRRQKFQPFRGKNSYQVKYVQIIEYKKESINSLILVYTLSYQGEVDISKKTEKYK
jgi:hypothetical protein